MAIRVRQVPNPWSPINNGEIWELTREEYDRMPRFQPTTDHHDVPIGLTMTRWYVGGNVYVKFHHVNDILDYQTGETIKKYQDKGCCEDCTERCNPVAFPCVCHD